MPEMTVAEVKKLKRLAEKVAAKNWVQWKGNPEVKAGPVSENTPGLLRGMPNGVGGQSICECDDLDFGERGAMRHAEYIAYANPERILRLLETISHVSAVKEEEQARQTFEEFWASGACKSDDRTSAYTEWLAAKASGGVA